MWCSQWLFYVPSCQYELDNKSPDDYGCDMPIVEMSVDICFFSPYYQNKCVNSTLPAKLSITCLKQLPCSQFITRKVIVS